MSPVTPLDRRSITDRPRRRRRHVALALIGFVLGATMALGGAHKAEASTSVTVSWPASGSPSPASPQVYGTSVTFTVCLAAIAGAAVPTGTVTFTDSGQVLTGNVITTVAAAAPCTTGGRRAMAQFTTTALTVSASHSITAVYTPSGVFSCSPCSPAGAETYTITYAADGSGTMTTPTTTVNNGSSANAITFTYVAAAGGTSNGSVTMVVPAGWTPPATSAGPGYTTASVGTVAVAAQTITVSGLTLASGATLTLVYGSGSTATASTTDGAQTWQVQEESTAGGTLTNLASSPSITVVSAVTSVSPNGGPAGGGTSVTITGGGFTGSTAVKFGATNATTFAVNSNSQITATSPAGAGTVDVTVVTPGGTTATSGSDLFAYAAPTVTMVTPNRGANSGGGFVIVTGTNFASGASVSFGGVSSPTVTVESATRIVAVAPASASTTTIDITVTTAASTSATVAADHYTYFTPSAVDNMGLNDHGQVGDNTSGTNRLGAVQVVGSGGTGTLTNIVQVAGGQFHGVALKSDGTVWAWGDNANGELGQNSASPATSNSPLQVKGPGGVGFLTGIVAIAANYGSQYNLALKSDGTVWSWGYNGHGQLGNNNTTMQLGVGEVLNSSGTGYLNGVVAITAGGDHVQAVMGDGTVYAWGNNSNGQIGQNSAGGNFLLPVQVKGPGGVGTLTGVVSASNGFVFSTVLKSDGSVWTWGANSNGQLGDNSGIDQYAPVQVKGPGGVGTLGSILDVRASNYHAVALKSDGSVWTWGYNFYGQLGINSTADQHLVVQEKGPGGVGTIANVVAISVGGWQTYDVKSDGTLWSCGWNQWGELGINNQTQQNSPAQALGFGASGTLGSIVGVGNGEFTTMTLVPKLVITSVSPTVGPLAGGTSVTITGSGFTGATAVKFGSTAATGYTVNSDTQITATSPAESAGTVDITVTTADGVSPTSAADQFTYSAGSLSITAPGAFSLGSAIQPGSTISGASLGALSYTNTLNDGLSWSVTVAATDLYNSGNASTVPFTSFSVTVGQTVNPAGPTPTGAGPTSLSGPDTTPGTTYSNPLTLANGTSVQNGSYTQSGNAITVVFPANLLNSGTMSSTLQYTITG